MYICIKINILHKQRKTPDAIIDVEANVERKTVQTYFHSISRTTQKIAFRRSTLVFTLAIFAFDIVLKQISKAIIASVNAPLEWCISRILAINQ